MLVAHPGRVPVHVPEERLLPAIDDLHGPAGAQRQHARVDLHRQVLPGAERAAHPGQRHPYLLGGQPEARRDLVAVHVQPLGGDVQVHPAVLGRYGQAGLGSQERLVLHADLVLPGDHDGRGELRADPDGLVAQHVAGVVDPRAVRIERGPARIGHRLAELVVHHDRLRRPAGRSGWSAATSATGSPW
nr:hypothetical protein GCM10020093_110700 [Planobispora longispora]